MIWIFLKNKIWKMKKEFLPGSEGDKGRQGQEMHQDAFLCLQSNLVWNVLDMCSVTCLQPVLKKVTCPLFHLEQKNLQISQIFWIHIRKINLIPLYTSYFQNSPFGITKSILIPKWKIEASRKDLLYKHKKCFAKQISSLSPSQI